MSEQQLTRAIIDAVNASGLAYVWRNQAGRARGGKTHLAPAGTPDIVGYATFSGQFVGFEVKVESRRKAHAERRRLQQEFRDEAQKRGAIVWEVVSVQEAVGTLVVARGAIWDWRSRLAGMRA